MKEKIKNNKKLVISICIIAIIAIVGFVFFAGSDDAPPKRETTIIGLSVYEQKISDKVEALGTAMANESIALTSNTTETIKEINFEDGQMVKKGDVIAVLDQNAELARMSAIRAKLREENRELQRVKTLLSKKAATKREFDERNTSLLVTTQEIKEVQAAIDERTLKAPFDGFVGIRRLSVGALVQPGDIITTLDDTSLIKLDFTVPAIYLSKLEKDLPVIAKSESNDGKFFEGKVSSIDTRVDPVTRSILVRAAIDNKEGEIKPGILMQVKLLEKDRMSVIVPEESITQRGEKHFVFVISDDNKVTEKEVQIGVREKGIVEIADGLKAGENIVVRGMGEVRDGQEVKVKEIWKKIRDSQFDPAVDEKAEPKSKPKPSAGN